MYLVEAGHVAWTYVIGESGTSPSSNFATLVPEFHIDGQRRLPLANIDYNDSTRALWLREDVTPSSFSGRWLPIEDPS